MDPIDSAGSWRWSPAPLPPGPAVLSPAGPLPAPAQKPGHGSTPVAPAPSRPEPTNVHEAGAELIRRGAYRTAPPASHRSVSQMS